MTIIADQANLAEPLTRAETLQHVRDKRWQTFRSKLRSQPLTVRKESLLNWLESNGFNRGSRVQVGNYLQVLKKAGVLNAKRSNPKSKNTQKPSGSAPPPRA
jgi:hypothetical protein